MEEDLGTTVPASSFHHWMNWFLARSLALLAYSSSLSVSDIECSLLTGAGFLHHSRIS